MQETEEMWVWSLGWEDSLEKGMATHSSILAWRTAMDRGAWQAIVHRVAKSSTGLKTLSLHIGLKLSMPLRDFWEFPQYEGMVISAPGCLPLQNSFHQGFSFFSALILNLKWNSPLFFNPKEGLPWWLSDKESACQCRRYRFNPWVGKIPWRMAWQPTPVFLPGEFQG